MSLWDKKEPATEAPSKGAEIRKMVGHEGKIENAAAAAPTSTAGGVPSEESGNVVRRKVSTTRTPRQAAAPQFSEKDILNAEREKARQEAIQKIGEEMARDVAGVPYEVWAFVAQDEELRLATDEEKELAEAYHLVAQTLPLSTMNPLLIAALFLASRNAKIVRKKMMEHKKRLEMEGIEEVEQAKAAQV